MIKHLFTIAFSLLCASVYAQQDPIYKDLLLTKTDRNVQINFVLLTGSTCFGIYIYRSADSVQFEQIGEIPGTCGSPVEPVFYQFVDENPLKNTTACHKISFGGTTYSDNRCIDFPVLTHNKLQIRPHPVQQNCKIYFENQRQEQLKAVIRNLLGNKVYEFTSNSSHIELNTLEIPSGIYSIAIYNENNTIVAIDKLIVKHE